MNAYVKSVYKLCYEPDSVVYVMNLNVYRSVFELLIFPSDLASQRDIAEMVMHWTPDLSAISP